MKKKNSWQLRHLDDGNFHHLIDGVRLRNLRFFFRNMNCHNCQNLLLGHHLVSRHSFRITLTSMISTMFIVNSAKQSKNFFVLRSTIFGNGWFYLRTLCPTQSRPKSTPTRKTATRTVAAIQAKCSLRSAQVIVSNRVCRSTSLGVSCADLCTVRNVFSYRQDTFFVCLSCPIGF